MRALQHLLAIGRHAGIQPAELRTIPRHDSDLAASTTEKELIRWLRGALQRQLTESAAVAILKGLHATQ